MSAGGGAVGAIIMLLFMPPKYPPERKRSLRSACKCALPAIINRRHSVSGLSVGELENVRSCSNIKSLHKPLPL